MFEKRATYWYWVSFALLLSTCFFVITGIFVFYWGNTSKELKAASELENQRGLEQVQLELQKLTEESELVYGKKAVSEKSKELTYQLKRLTEIESNENVHVDELRKLILNANTIANGIASFMKDKNTPPISLTLQPGVRKEFDVYVMDEVFNEGVLKGIDWTRLSTLTNRLSQLFDDLSITDHLAKAKALLNLKTFDTQLLMTLDGAIDSIKKQRTDDAENWSLRYLKRQGDRQALMQQESVLKDRVEASAADRNYVVFMGWVPDLTVRIGAVILILFVTKILLATYRYTAGLYTFYVGVADSIRLLQPAGDGLWYDISHLQLLLSGLRPNNLSIESVATPSDSLTELAKLWIQRK